MTEPCFVGLDIGAAMTKAVIMDSRKNILGYAVMDSGADFQKAADKAYTTARKAAGKTVGSEAFILATGYGRRNVPFVHTTKTEISCHARGSYHHYPRAHTLVDIGGQDSKVIKVDKDGRRVNFKMNRKCAAGTGAFLEDIANRLKIKVDRLNGMAEAATRNVTLGSYCTVFTATEILAKLRQNVDVKDIIKGLFDSVIKRALEMDPLEGSIVMSGGVVAHNPYLVRMFEDRIGRKIFVPPLSQLTGALGASLYALETKGGLNA